MGSSLSTLTVSRLKIALEKNFIFKMKVLLLLLITAAIVAKGDDELECYKGKIGTETEKCPNDDDVCITKYDKDGKVEERHCAPKTMSASKCGKALGICVCTGDKCNSAIKPGMMTATILCALVARYILV